MFSDLGGWKERTQGYFCKKRANAFFNGNCYLFNGMFNGMFNDCLMECLMACADGRPGAPYLWVLDLILFKNYTPQL